MGVAQNSRASSICQGAILGIPFFEPQPHVSVESGTSRDQPGSTGGTPLPQVRVSTHVALLEPQTPPGAFCQPKCVSCLDKSPDVKIGFLVERACLRETYTPFPPVQIPTRSEFAVNPDLKKQPICHEE